MSTLHCHLCGSYAGTTSGWCHECARKTIDELQTERHRLDMDNRRLRKRCHERASIIGNQEIENTRLREAVRVRDEFFGVHTCPYCTDMAGHSDDCPTQTCPLDTQCTK